MRPGPYFLITLLLIAGGIFVYHNLVADSPRTPAFDRHTSYVDTETRLPDPPAPPPGPAAEEEPGLRAGALEMRAEANQREIARLWEAIRRLGRSGPASEPDPSDSSDAGTGGGGTTLPSLSPRDVLDTETPVFSDDTVRTLSAYIDEINRRKQEERMRTRLSADLARLDLGLDEEQEKAVIDQTLKFQKRRTDLLRRPYARDEAGQAERRDAVNALQEEYASIIKRLVPNEAAQKILDSRVSRSMGFFSGGAFGGARGPRGRVRNR